MAETKPALNFFEQFGQAEEAGQFDIVGWFKQDLRWRAISLCFFMLVQLGPFIALVTSNGADEGSIFRQLGYIALLGWAFWAAAPWQNGTRTVMLPIPLIVALAWCLLSLTWSAVPGIGLRRLVLTVSVVWSAVIIVRNTGYRMTMENLRLALGIGLVLNILTVLVAPSIGIHSIEADRGWSSDQVVGSWRGIMTDKNLAGAATAICFLIFFFDGKQIKPFLRFGALLLAAFFLFKTHSKTSIGLVGVGCVLGLAYERISYSLRMVLIPAGLITASVASMAIRGLKGDTGGEGLSASAFTGRGSIWQMLFHYAQDHFWTGAGFGSFWNVGADSPVYKYGQGFSTLVSVGHNGYLDLLVTVGFPGLLLAIVAAFIWPLIRMLTSHNIRPAKGGLICALLVFCIGHNFTESSLLDRDALTGMVAILTLSFILYALPSRSSSSSSRSRKRKRKQREAGEDLLSTMKSRGGPRNRA